jgi:subtilisin family serine protease
MLHLTSRSTRSAMALGVLAALLAAIAPPAHAAIEPAATTIAASPASLAVTVPLGTSASRTVTLTNTSGQAITPLLYEAYPAPPVASLRAAQIASDLRAVALPRQPDRIDPQLAAAFQASADGRADFVIYLRAQADLGAAYAIHDWAARGRYVYQALSDHAERSQRDLRAQLAARGLRAQPLWIANAVLVRGSAADARALADRADVALVRANRVTALEPGAEGGPVVAAECDPGRVNSTVCWNIRKVGADRVWADFGVAGQGVVVANIDTGVDYRHPALKAQYRGYLGGDRYDHNYNWFHPAGIAPAPEDQQGHGTHTMGTIVARGNGTAAQPAVGIAPQARWIAAWGCSAFCSEADLLLSAQWILAPTDLNGRNPRPDLRPMIVNNSWGTGGGYDFYLGYTTAWRAAGIFPVFVSGNTGSACGSVYSPGDYANVAAVGATDANDSIAWFSSRGPTRDGRRKPDFAAPGQDVVSTYPGGGASYAELNGTSMAAPHLSGLVALLWSANPALIGDYDATYAIVRDTARRASDTQCGDAAGAPNNVYGYGRIDAYAAVARARVDVPWLSASAAPRQIAAHGAASISVTLDATKVPRPGLYQARIQLFGTGLGQPPTTISIAMTVAPAATQATLTGRVISADTGAPIAATVGVKGGVGAPTDRTGTYTLTLPLGQHELIATAPSFQPAYLAVALAANQRAPDIVMQPDQPHLLASTAALTASVGFGQHPSLALAIGNSGTQPLIYQARVLPDRFTVGRSDEAGGPAYRWIDLPANAPRLALGDNATKDEVPLGIEFPFYGYTITDTLVTSNGALAFSIPTMPAGGLSRRCFPDTNILFYEIAPFRADLDPARGGAVRYATVEGGSAFVLSYENVPLHSGPLERRYTFQVVLRSDGRIVFQYQKLAPLPELLSVGVQRSESDYQELGCGSGTPIHDELAIELRPQPLATSWMRLARDAGTLKPGERLAIAAVLDWARPAGAALRGRVEITSNDPIRSRVVVPISALTQPAPHERILPMVDLSGR